MKILMQRILLVFQSLFTYDICFGSLFRYVRLCDEYRCKGSVLIICSGRSSYAVDVKMQMLFVGENLFLISVLIVCFSLLYIVWETLMQVSALVYACKLM